MGNEMEAMPHRAMVGAGAAACADVQNARKNIGKEKFSLNPFARAALPYSMKPAPASSPPNAPNAAHDRQGFGVCCLLLAGSRLAS